MWCPCLSSDLVNFPGLFNSKQDRRATPGLLTLRWRPVHWVLARPVNTAPHAGLGHQCFRGWLAQVLSCLQAPAPPHIAGLQNGQLARPQPLNATLNGSLNGHAGALNGHHNGLVSHVQSLMLHGVCVCVCVCVYVCAGTLHLNGWILHCTTCRLKWERCVQEQGHTLAQPDWQAPSQPSFMNCQTAAKNFLYS